jgi:hypothetical protein
MRVILNVLTVLQTFLSPQCYIFQQPTRGFAGAVYCPKSKCWTARDLKRVSQLDGNHISNPRLFHVAFVLKTTSNCRLLSVL